MPFMKAKCHQVRLRITRSTGSCQTQGADSFCSHLPGLSDLGAGETLHKQSLPYASDIYRNRPLWHAIVQAPLNVNKNMTTYQTGTGPLFSMPPALINGEHWCQPDDCFNPQRVESRMASACCPMNSNLPARIEAQYLTNPMTNSLATTFSTSVSPRSSGMNGETHGGSYLPPISVPTTLSERKEGASCDHSGVSRQSSTSLPPPYFSFELTEPSPPSTIAYRRKSLPCVNKPMDWHMTLDDFHWLASVLFPKRRPNKRKPTPSGTCRFCDVVCSRAGNLQQHVVFQHRQRIARKYIENDHYNQDLALAFTVLELDVGGGMSNMDANMGGHRTTEEASESDLFSAALVTGPVTSMASYPHLLARFHRFCMAEKWRGVHCSACGMLVQRKLNLSGHQAKCPAILGCRAMKSKSLPQHSF
ncbi:uncharacterized protein EI90DRAFT_1351593 [Cantharellus anzutake]|uniref:uncharacterized protein n=1 Tax=Cantharellus anzutake TaxID=1750568 RepID=UPI001903D24B|nr:uncharacterized protein EI90DRAFT_1351593 [Cantharellus anzutake]KAF8329835.1 hypothetical protein EI90DRAFT_1351593 [Cantharellus anzutake]